MAHLRRMTSDDGESEAHKRTLYLRNIGLDSDKVQLTWLLSEISWVVDQHCGSRERLTVGFDILKIL
jgi:hypothetical protein